MVNSKNVGIANYERRVQNYYIVKSHELQSTRLLMMFVIYIKKTKKIWTAGLDMIDQSTSEICANPVRERSSGISPGPTPECKAKTTDFLWEWLWARSKMLSIKQYWSGQSYQWVSADWLRPQRYPSHQLVPLWPTRGQFWNAKNCRTI